MWDLTEINVTVPFLIILPFLNRKGEKEEHITVFLNSKFIPQDTFNSKIHRRKRKKIILGIIFFFRCCIKLKSKPNYLIWFGQETPEKTTVNINEAVLKSKQKA